MTKRLAAIAFALLAAPAGAAAQDVPMRRGEVLATQLCGDCHAIGDVGISAHAAAPRFRNLERRLDLDDFVERLRQGLSSGHVDMPTFRFSREDAQAMVRYLRSVQAP